MKNASENIAFLPPYLNPNLNPSPKVAACNNDADMQSVVQLILALRDPNLREDALCRLCKVFNFLLQHKKGMIPNLAMLLWNSPGTVAVLLQHFLFDLLQEVVSIYSLLSPPNLATAQSNRICNVLALLQCMASHPDTKILFLNAYVPLYVYPFLNTHCRDTTFEHLRLSTLGVIGFFVTEIDTDVIAYFLSGEMVPLCMRNMEIGKILSKTVATYIIRQILLCDVGLEYICEPQERFFALCRVMAIQIALLAQRPSFSKLLKLIIGCYLRLSDNPRARDALRSFLPRVLRDGTFTRCLQEDASTVEMLQRLLHNLYRPPR
ncbi:Protein involved in cell differentiation/sexual development [Handroanthus impetiginosus]|uniref:Protein involved in cell differentiation/sexual development n=1 Tax=Handroanthus impetiginosus TaxID=429701 RepID=A0A2G9G189_9LAMI|nr:Protein involved in cell differentiation/sexual development [Handroanthus impetiginosus]